MTPREAIEKCVCICMNEKVDKLQDPQLWAIENLLSDLAEIVSGLQKPTEGISHESVRDNNGKHTGTLKIPVTYPLSEAYNQAITDIAKLLQTTVPLRLHGQTKGGEDETD